jgi:hypothetical protein
MHHTICHVFIDGLAKVSADERRAHDAVILQVIDKMSYNKISADFGQPNAGSALASVTSPPPPSQLRIS